MDWLTEKLKDPEYRRLFKEESRKLELQYQAEPKRLKKSDPWWKNTIIGVLAHPATLYRNRPM